MHAKYMHELRNLLMPIPTKQGFPILQTYNQNKGDRWKIPINHYFNISEPSQTQVYL
jgi:hypothetical protein